MRETISPGSEDTSLPIAAFLDESRRRTHHPILAVGGFVCALADVPAIERVWPDAKTSVGVDRDMPVRYAASWPDRGRRLPLIERIPRLGIEIKGVVALLEDFRPESFAARKALRKDMYIQRRAFEYVLQRLASPLYLPGDMAGPHLVFLDRHDDFRCYDEEYDRARREGWSFGNRRVPALGSVGFAAAPAAMSAGPAMEIADLILSVATRWVEAMVAVDAGKNVQDLAELQAAMRALLPLFPSNPRRAFSWRGYSLIAHKEARTGKEVIYDRIDDWLYDLQRRDVRL